MGMNKEYQLSGYLKKTIVLCLLSFWLNQESFAQTELSKFNFYGTLAGVPGVEALLNVEVRLHSSEKLTWYGRAGFGFAGILAATGGKGALTAITMLTGKKNHHFEMSGGAFFGKDQDYEGALVIAHFDVGYRYQKPTGGFLFKVKTGILGVGIGLGYAF